MSRKRGRGTSGFERWELWWEFNKDAYLDLKKRYEGRKTLTGSSGFLVGRGRKDLARSVHTLSDEAVLREVVSVLKSALAEDDSGIVISALTAAARIVPAGKAALVLDDITSQLSSKHLEVRQVACLSLGILGAPGACGACEDLMLDTAGGRKLVGGQPVDRMTRAFAALALGLINDGGSAPKLRELVEKVDADTQKNLVSCALLALGLMNDKSCREENARFLIAQLFNFRMDPLMRAFAAVSLGKVGGRAVLPALVYIFDEEEEDHNVRQSCALALGRIATLADKSAVRALERCLEEGRDIPTRCFALIALAKIGARSANFDVHEEAHRKINDLFLTTVERASSAQQRAWAALAAALHAMEHDPLQPGTVKGIREAFLETGNPSEKSACAVSLGLLRAEESGEMLLCELLGSKDEILRGYLCVGLGLMRWRPSIGKMREFLGDESFSLLRIQAATGLGLMGDLRTGGLLIQTIRNSRSLYVTSSAAKALGLLGDRNAVEPLLAILKKPDAGSFARQSAIEALAMLCEKTELPWSAALAEDFNYCLNIDAMMRLFSVE
jgi:HEAT repeat protein